MSENTEPLPVRAFERTFALEDISIRAGGDGRTVVAYAAPFDTEAEITDQDGHYVETLARTSFDKTLSESLGQIQVFYNHGKTLYGTPSERFSLPIGRPEEIRPDGRGLLTVTRYNKNPLADEVLESIHNGDIKGQSFSGRMVRSTRTRSRSGGLDSIVRTEIALREYGPTPMPAYKEAGIVGVRMEELVDTLQGLSDEDKAELLQLLGTSRTETPPAVDAALHGTSAINDTPATGHLSGPSPAERRLRLLALKEQLT